MKSCFTFASDRRIHALICCSAAVLLSACGGGSSDAGTGQQNQTAGAMYQSTSNQSEATVGAPATTPAATAKTDEAPAAADSDPAPLAAAAASPSIYNLYVSTTGSDSNPGSQSAPFKTISRAASVAKPSTTVHVAAGTYNGNVTTKVSGTATGRIRFVSTTKWGAKIVGSGTEAMWTNNANFADIDGFDISGPGRLGIVNYGSNTLVSGNHVHDLKISGGCNGSGGAGIVNANYSATDDDTIGNVVHDIGVPGACNGVQGIYHSNLRGKIQNNIVYRVSAWGIHLWHAANAVTISNNTVFGNGSGGMGGGIVTGTGDSPGGVVLNNTKVLNNIVYNNAGGITQYCYDGQACIGSTNTVANNVVYGNRSAVIMRVGSATGTIAADPKFVNFQANGTGNYRLQSSSPAVNKGLSSSAPTFDMDYVARPRGGAHDIGAYESF
jgi:parallel beta-helix repeat protein